MSSQRLNIAQVNPSSRAKKSQANSQRLEIQATMERMWHQNPEQFNPERDCIQRQRIQKTVQLIKESISLDKKRAVDLGCGSGVLSRVLRDAGADVDAVDIAGNALKALQEHNMQHIRPVQDCFPMTSLEDDAYDVVVCTETIGYLPASVYRLAFAELSRLLKNDGRIICSTELDLNSEDALERLNALAETEFTIDLWVFSHHRLFLRLCQFLKWIGCPTSRLRQSSFAMNFFEKICRFLYPEKGISHALFMGKRRPMTFPLPAKEIPREMPHKRELWT